LDSSTSEAEVKRGRGGANFGICGLGGMVCIDKWWQHKAGKMDNQKRREVKKELGGVVSTWGVAPSLSDECIEGACRGRDPCERGGKKT